MVCRERLMSDTFEFDHLPLKQLTRDQHIASATVFFQNMLRRYPMARRGAMTSTSVFLGLVLLANVLAGCATTITCNQDDPITGKDCYECTRKATSEAEKIDQKIGKKVSSKERIDDLTEQCLRERGYLKQKPESRY